jgi:hypothetical protein
MTEVRIEIERLGEVSVLADKLWGARTQRSFEHFSIARDLMPCELITYDTKESQSQRELRGRAARGQDPRARVPPSGDITPRRPFGRRIVS